MLILFDIDGTLLRSQGAGVRAMEQALRSIHGELASLKGIEVAGRLDVLIWRDARRRLGLDAADDDHRQFRALYAENLRSLFESGVEARAMPGVHDLVNEVHEAADLTLGVLTGNYAETGRLKMRHAGLDPDRFIIDAWGDEGASRRDLPPVAMRRFEERAGRSISPTDVVIIGDTPHDIDCARHHGCRSIGVATGQFSAAQLRGAGADLAVESLAATNTILSWIRSSGTSRRTRHEETGHESGTGRFFQPKSTHGNVDG
jgi:phosphoglycolate phosphatase